MFKAATLQQLPENLYVLCQILQKASMILQRQYQIYQKGEDFNIDKKTDASPVTQADFLVNDFLIQQLSQIQPNVPVLSEEGDHNERETWDEFWLIDPLDGTKEFINQTGEFTINLSLIRQHQSEISALAVPTKNVIYIVQKGELPFKYSWGQISTLEQYDGSFGADLSIHQHHKTLNIAMSRRPQRSGRYAEFLQYLEEHKVLYNRVQAGSAYKFCMMIEGEIDLYPRFHPTSEWDTAAGQGLLQSIGGDVFDLKGKPFSYNKRQSLLNGDFVAIRSVDDWSIVQSFLQHMRT